MASITLKNIPEHLHVFYKHRAKAHSNSLQAEIFAAMSESAALSDGEDVPSLKELSGSLVSKRKGVTIEEMNEGVSEMLRKRWK